MAIFLEVGKWTNSCCYSVWTCSRMQMKVLICPVTLGYALPWRPWNIRWKLSRIVARWAMWEGCGGHAQRGFLAESFSQNAMWPSWPHGAVGILRGVELLTVPGWAIAADGCLWWLLVFLDDFCTWKEGGADTACHSTSLTLFYEWNCLRSTCNTNEVTSKSDELAFSI